MNVKLQDAKTTNDSAPASHKVHDTPARQVKGVAAYHTPSGTATVKIQGSFDDTTYFDVTTLTAETPVEVTLFPYMRAVISGISGATVTVWLFY